ncbi:transketolase [bacterium]|nr:transketolase [bacterium]
MLAADGVQKANSGHPGMPMGMADCAAVLFTRFLRYHPGNPSWPDRDRFVLSAGHGSMLLYSLLHLAGYPVSLEDLKQFRQWGSRTPGHPEYGVLPGVETTTGPLGQGFANGVGMALAGKILREKFNPTGTERPFSYRVFGIVSDGDLMEGISSEAASIAGHLRLGNIVYFYDDNHITIEGETGLAFSENVEKRFEAYGWHTVSIDGHDPDAIASALQQGIDEKTRPSLILTRTHIGYGSPKKQDSSEAHGAPLGADEVKATKEKLGWPPDKPFFVPDEVYSLFRDRVKDLTKEYDQWLREFALWKKENPGKAGLYGQMAEKSLPQDLETQLLSALPDKPAATRAISSQVLNRAAGIVPSLYGGSADLAPSTLTLIKGESSIGPGSFGGRNLHFGIREHGMGGILNGMALSGCFLPYGATFLVFSDYLRPSIRLASLLHARVIYVFTHDSIFVGEDGPTHQPVEQIAALRSIPGLKVFRPADGVETAIAWASALRRADGPTALCLTRQNVPLLQYPEGFDPLIIHKGGYVLRKEKNKAPQIILVATGSEVGVAVDAEKLLSLKGMHVRIVSMPCLEAFLTQDEEYRLSVIPEHIPVVVIEAGISQGWHVITRAPFLMIGMNRFGASAPYKVLAEKFGFTGVAAAEKIVSWYKDIK